MYIWYSVAITTVKQAVQDNCVCIVTCVDNIFIASVYTQMYNVFLESSDGNVCAINIKSTESIGDLVEKIHHKLSK